MNVPNPARRRAHPLRASILPALVLAAASAFAESESGSGKGSDGGRDRHVIEIRPSDQSPTVRAIVPIDGANVFFLNHRGQVGVAKFSPGLSPIGWQFYSEIKLNALPALALGPHYSVLATSPLELTQAFDTDQNLELDFFQAIVADWPGRGQGVAITAGPLADPHGRVLYALSPHPLTEGETPKARLMAWLPETGKSVPVTESELPIESFALGRDGLLATRLSLPDYTDGYFLSLTELPPPVAGESGAPTAGPLPFTLPSLILPAELTKRDRPLQPTFFHEEGRQKILLTCPESRHLVEVVPDRGVGGLWQGSVLLRGLAPKPLHTLVEMAPGAILGGGDEGFLPLQDDPAVYRLVRLALAIDGIELRFSQPVDRFEAVKAENYSVKAIALGGGETALTIEPVVEANGRTVVLKTQALAPGHVLRVVCQNLPSEKGATLLSSTAFYTLHER